MKTSTADNKEKPSPRGYSFLLDADTPSPFSVGLVLNLQTTIERYKKNRFPVHLAGWIRPHMLIAYHRHYDTGILAIPNGTEMIARYIFEGQIYGFVTKLFNKQSEPLPLWFLEYPLEIEVINLRQSSRIPITIEVKTPDGEIYFTRDISKQGASLMISSQSLRLERKIGDTIELSFRLPDDTFIDKLKAVIIRQYSEQTHQLLGVKFDETSQRHLHPLAQYLEKLEKDFLTVQPPPIDL